MADGGGVQVFTDAAWAEWEPLIAEVRPRGKTPPTIAETLGLSAETVRGRIRRFNAEGLAAFEDRHRSGRPATFSTDAVAAVIATALTSPRRLGLPFASWTLDRLAAHLLEHEGIAMRRSRIDEILLNTTWAVQLRRPA